jgi:hypothetical protein
MLQLQYVDDMAQLQCVDDTIQLQYVDNMIQLQYVDDMLQLQYLDDIIHLQCVDDVIQLIFATDLSFWQSFFSLALLQFGLGYPPDRCLFCSVPSPCSPSFYTHIPPIQFGSIHPSILI